MSRVRLQSYQFYILLALAEQPLAGARIRQGIIGDTLGLYARDSTLYDALMHLCEAGLIERDKDRTYRLTDMGRSRLEAESRTLRRAVQLSQARLHWH